MLADFHNLAMVLASVVVADFHNLAMVLASVVVAGFHNLVMADFHYLERTPELVGASGARTSPESLFAYVCKCELETFNHVQFELESTLKLKKKKKNSSENNEVVVVEEEVNVVGVLGTLDTTRTYMINPNHSQSVSPSHVFLYTITTTKSDVYACVRIKISSNGHN